MAGSPTTESSIMTSLAEHWQAIVSCLVVMLGWTTKRIVKRNDEDNKTRDDLIGVLSRKIVALEMRLSALEMANGMCPACPKVPHHEHAQEAT